VADVAAQKETSLNDLHSFSIPHVTIISSYYYYCCYCNYSHHRCRRCYLYNVSSHKLEIAWWYSTVNKNRSFNFIWLRSTSQCVQHSVTRSQPDLLPCVNITCYSPKSLRQSRLTLLWYEMTFNVLMCC